MTAEQRTYRIRRSCGNWYVNVYEGWTVDKLLEQIGPFAYYEACSFAKDFGLPDADKGQDGKGVKHD